MMIETDMAGIKNVYELYEIVNNSNVMIYGAGIVGKRFYKKLAELGIEKNVMGFVVSDGEDSGSECEGLPIFCIGSVEKACDKNALMCIAVHDIYLDMIIKKLKSYGFMNYVWVYPFQFEMMLGVPLEDGVGVPIGKIWDANRPNYHIVARYAAIEQYYGKNDRGYDAYVNVMSAYNGASTSKERLKRFIESIKFYEKESPQINEINNRILLREDGLIIDGNHRATKGIYFGRKSLECNVYSNEAFEKFYKLDAVSESTRFFHLNKQNALALGIDAGILDFLDDVRLHIDERVKSIINNLI